ncbi:uncharacterized protein LOC142972954 [Anticarsia gemmatalis]|uniref:uncharacterized protein LOC142972954 n=1 Tax=Anticarsia gemmatalis TaxID=129554 RepID=UPI003F76F573
MNFTFLCLVIIPFVLLPGANALYNKDVTCIVDTGKEPVCKTSPRISRRSDTNNVPSHDPYIPRKNTILFNCSVECHTVIPHSMTDITTPNLNLTSCHLQESGRFDCEPIRYNYLKNVDKLLFLANTIRDKTFYIVDCLVYSGGERVCHKKDNSDSYANLVDTGTLARPNETNVLAQDEFICEESEAKEVKCDLNPYVPFKTGLELKQAIQFGDSVLLKSGPYVVILTRSCKDSWCGYSGTISSTRRQFTYKPPGGHVFRCYYAKRQQVCRLWYSLKNKEVYNERGWLR